MGSSCRRRPDRARGRDVTNDPPDKRPVNMVFQNYALFPHLERRRQHRVRAAPEERREGPDQAARRRGARARPPGRPRPAQAEPAERRPAAARRARPGAREPAQRPPPRRAARRARPEAPQQLQIELKRVQAEVGITFVYVTHDQEEALTMSDRIAVMNRGKVEQLGTPEELYERPTRPASWRTSSARRTCSAGRSSGRRRLGAGPARRAATRASSPGTGFEIGRTVELSIRPESILIKATNGTAPRGRRADPGAGRAGCVPRGQRPVPGPHERRPGHHRMAPKTGQRLPVGSDVDVVWPPAEALVLAGASGRHEEEAPA